MSLITLDIGNSRIGAAVVDASHIRAEFRGGGGASGRSIEARVAEAFDWAVGQAREREEVQGLVIASVVPKARELFEALWAGNPLTELVARHIVDHRSPLPFRIDVAAPAMVGADRWCNVAGAVALGHNSAVIADLGTANTYDVLDEGVFRGGLIGAGAITAHRALFEAGAQLQPSSFDYPADLIGKNTAEAMLAGSFHQAVGGVRHILDLVRDRFPGAAVLVTGGLGEMLGPELGADVVYRADLTHLGAAAIGERVGLWFSGDESGRAGDKSQN